MMVEAPWRAASVYPRRVRRGVVPGVRPTRVDHFFSRARDAASLLRCLNDPVAAKNKVSFMTSKEALAYPAIVALAIIYSYMPGTRYEYISKSDMMFWPLFPKNCPLTAAAVVNPAQARHSKLMLFRRGTVGFCREAI